MFLTTALGTFTISLGPIVGLAFVEIIVFPFCSFAPNPIDAPPPNNSGK